MYKDGYFRRSVKELDPEHESRNYDKSIRWIEKGMIPVFLLEDMQKYINRGKKLNSKNHYQIEHNR